jgi:hypothetical protein
MALCRRHSAGVSRLLAGAETVGGAVRSVVFRLCRSALLPFFHPQQIWGQPEGAPRSAKKMKNKKNLQYNEEHKKIYAV